MWSWTSTSYYVDVQLYIRRRLPVSIWTYNVRPWTSTSYYKDVQHNIHGRSSVSIWTYNVRPWTSISYYIDVQYYISGSVSLWTYNMTSVDAPPSFSMDVQRVAVHHLLYGRHFISVCPSVSLWTYDMTYVDVHQCLYERTTCGRGRPPVTLWS